MSRSMTAARPLFALLAAVALLSGVMPAARPSPVSASARLSPVAASPFQAVLAALDVPYTENFDTLPATGSATWTNNSTIPGWYHARTGTGTTIVANDGVSNAGNLYSYGTNLTTDRALGSLGSGNVAVGNLFWGVRFENATGSTITSLDVAYTGEQWRGSGAAAQTAAFSYLVGSPAVTGSLAEFQSAGVAVPALDFTSPVTVGTVGALNGNIAANRTALSFTISGVSVPSGTDVMLRWSDPDHAGSDHGLSIDDFSVTPHSVAPPLSLTIDDVSLNEGDAGTTSFDFPVSLSAPAPAGGVSFDIATADGTAVAPGDYTARALTGQTIPAGATTYSFTVLVNGDISPESNETFLVNVTNVTNATVADGQGRGTIVNDELTRIHDVQGNGASTPIPGSTVPIEGVVVADFQGSDQLRGFFLEEEDADADADPGTSEGIFVFCSTCSTAVAEGQRVRATGAVSEFNNMTQVTASTAGSVVVTDAGDHLAEVTASSIDLPIAGNVDAFYESREGMKVTFTDTLTVSEYFQLARFGQMTLYEGGRPQQFTETNAPNVAGLVAHLDNLARRQVILDDDDNGQESFLLQPDGSQSVYYPTANGGFSVGAQGTDFFRGGDTVGGLTGVLHWSFPGFGANTWRIRPTAANPATFTVGNPRPATPPAVGGSIKAVSMNLLNYFTTIDTTASTSSGPCGPTATLDCRGADSVAELNRQRERASIVICSLDADVYGFMELENTTPSDTINDLLGAVNARCGGANPYAFVNTGGTLGTDAIRVQLIYRTNTLSPVGSPLVDLDPIHNRPPTAQTFDVVDPANSAFGERFTVVANHFKSKGCDASATGADADSGDGQACFNGRRTAQAARLLTWISSTVLPAAGDPDVLLLGDFNSYSMEDPINALESGGYTDLAASLIGPGSYSYLFDSQLGHLDYAFASSGLAADVTGVGNWHINADEVDLFDYNDEIFDSPGEANFEEKPDGSALVPPRVVFQPGSPYRASDHDPVIVGLFFPDGTAPDTTIDSSPPDPSASSSATFTFSGTDNVTPAGGLSFECQLDGGGFGPCTSPQTYTSLSDGSHTFQVRAIDGVGNVDPTPASYTWTIDATAPDTTITGSPPDPSNSSSATFTFIGSDAGTGVASFECQLDGGGFGPCPSPHTYTSLSDGSHTFEARAIDGVGNVDPTAASYTWTIDATRPGVTINQAAGQADPTGTSPINFTVVFTEPVTGFSSGDVVLTGSAGATTAVVTGGPTTWNVAVSGMTADGTVTASIPANRASDAVGNGNTASASTDNTVTFGFNVPPTATVTNGLCWTGEMAIGTITLTLVDADGDPLTLTLATNSNTTLVPNALVFVVGSGSHRSITVVARPRTSGVATLTFNLSDGTVTVPVVVTVRVGSDGNETINGTAGIDMIFGLDGKNTINGLGGNDLLCGGNGADTISGGAGNDIIDGANGGDTLNGGNDNDILRGSLGGDTLTGGAGADAFSGGAGRDTATDFNAAEGDTQDGTIP